MPFDGLVSFDAAPRAIVIAGSAYAPLDDAIAEIVSTLLNGVPERDRDLLHLDSASRSIGIDTTREFFNLLKTKSRSGQRIAIVKAAESMTASAANAILKSLEEPDDETIVILVTVRLHALPATIRSRCAVFRIPNSSVSDNPSWVHRYAQGSSSLLSVLEAETLQNLDESFGANSQTQMISAIHAGLAEIDALEIYLRAAFMDALSKTERSSELSAYLMRTHSLDQIEGRLLHVLEVLRQYRTQHLDRTQTGMRIASALC